MVDCTFIIFGITGDLSKSKILPALYNLVLHNKINNYAIIGAGLEHKSVDEIFAQAQDFIPNFNQNIVTKLKDRTSYIQINVAHENEFGALNKLILETEKKFNLSGNRLVYCATPATLFAHITKNLCNVQILQKKNQDDKIWNRIAYEKPFGYDLKSAKKINKEILALLNEFQIFRVDHYLAKDVVENILYIRFTNHIFESLWSNKHIESVQITLSEKSSVANRGSYYDNFGALSDIVQNHILQLMALITMDAPKQLEGNDIRSCKAEIIKRIQVKDGLLGQYDGYLQELGVKANSKTETFAYLQLLVNNKRWKGVPFYIKTGKCLPNKETRIHIAFKSVDCKLTAGDKIENNHLTIDLYPKGGFSFEINAKKPGVRGEIIPVVMDFCYQCLFVPSTPEAYENLILDIIKGDQAVSVRFDEIELAWKVMDKVRKLNLPLYKYAKNSWGPKELDYVSKKNNISWRQK